MTITADMLIMGAKHQRDATANDSDKTFTVPTGKIWVLYGVEILIATSADAGNRTMRIELQDDTPLVYWTCRANGAVAASSSVYFQAAPGVKVTTGTHEVFALPTWAVLLPGWSIRVRDSAAIAAAADDMTVSLWYSEIDVG